MESVFFLHCSDVIFETLGELNFECNFLKRFYLFIFRERRREGEREGEKHQCVVAFHTPSTGDLT